MNIKFQWMLLRTRVKCAWWRLKRFPREYVAAVREFPAGARCGWCKRPNFFCDDVGWFAITPNGDDTRVTCRACYSGPLGKAHIARYGIGER